MTVVMISFSPYRTLSTAGPIAQTAPPDCANQHADQKQHGRRSRSGDLTGDDPAGNRADHNLTVDPDVPESGPETNQQAGTDDQQWCHLFERLGQPIAVEQSALDDQAVDLDRVVTGQQKQHRSGQAGANDGQQ